MNFIEAILKKKEEKLAPIIAEVKRLNPKLAADGKMKRDSRDAGTLSSLYEKGGAVGISVVVEKEFFGGDPENDVPRILQSTNLPLLVKDFILTEKQVDFFANLAKGNEERVSLLLITHRLQEKLPQMINYVKNKGMTVLLETRGEEDLGILPSLPEMPRLIGVNNRNIDELEKDGGSLKINSDLVGKIKKVAKGSLVISESAHLAPEDVLKSLRVGADAVLVGTAFMLADNPEKEVRKFLLEGQL
jgi:indole-3-glycerol phosphate synthase